MPDIPDILTVIRGAFIVLIILGLWMLPAWVARQNKKGKFDMGIVRVSSWVLGWTGVGWLYALYWAIKK